MQNQVNIDSAKVIAKPPRIYLTAIVIGAALQLVWPFAFIQSPAALIAGILLICAGIGLMIWSDWEFRKAETAVAHQFGTSKLVTTGPFRFTRNPMYLAMTTILIGMALGLGNLWMVLVVVPLLFIMNYGVINREEAYLSAKFGQPFLDYKAKVRRWL